MNNKLIKELVRLKGILAEKEKENLEASGEIKQLKRELKKRAKTSDPIKARLFRKKLRRKAERLAVKAEKLLIEIKEALKDG